VFRLIRITCRVAISNPHKRPQKRRPILPQRPTTQAVATPAGPALRPDRRGGRLAPGAGFAARVHPAKHVMGLLAAVGTVEIGRVGRARIDGQH